MPQTSASVQRSTRYYLSGLAMAVLAIVILKLGSASMGIAMPIFVAGMALALTGVKHSLS